MTFAGEIAFTFLIYSRNRHPYPFELSIYALLGSEGGKIVCDSYCYEIARNNFVPKLLLNSLETHDVRLYKVSYKA